MLPMVSAAMTMFTAAIGRQRKAEPEPPKEHESDPLLICMREYAAHKCEVLDRLCKQVEAALGSIGTSQHVKTTTRNDPHATIIVGAPRAETYADPNNTTLNLRAVKVPMPVIRSEIQIGIHGDSDQVLMLRAFAISAAFGAIDLALKEAGRSGA